MLWPCKQCSAAYAVGLSRCPQCGATDYQEAVMPKISKSGGPTYGTPPNSVVGSDQVSPNPAQEEAGGGSSTTFTPPQSKSSSGGLALSPLPAPSVESRSVLPPEPIPGPQTSDIALMTDGVIPATGSDLNDTN